MPQHRERHCSTLRRAPRNEPMEGLRPRLQPTQSPHNIFSHRKPPSKSKPLSEYFKGVVSTPADPAKPCGFLKILPEIRKQIYGLTVLETWNRSPVSVYGQGSGNGLLATNHQIRNAVLLMHQKHKYFVFNNAAAAIMWLNVLKPGQLDNVSDVRIACADWALAPHRNRPVSQTGIFPWVDRATQAQREVDSVKKQLGKATKGRAAAPWIKVKASIRMLDGSQE